MTSVKMSDASCAICASLTSEVRERYLSKISLINNTDPYDCDESTFTRDVELFPNIAHGDIFDYFVCGVSAYTATEFKAYKSLDSYKFFKCGWVRDIRVKEISGKILVLGNVKHSQRIHEECLQPWAIVEKDGAILNGHCTCIAGLGETCSHLAAVAFAIAHAVLTREEVSVTGKKCVWVEPNTKIGEAVPWSSLLVKYNQVKFLSTSHEVPAVTREEESRACVNIRDHGITPNIMRVSEPFCFEEDGDAMIVNVLSQVYEDTNKSLSLEDLREKGRQLCLQLSEEDCMKIEEQTRGQSGNKSWFEHRIGRITASKFKNVCCTTIEKPAMSTIKAICYPTTVKFTSKYTEYGCKHEKDALLQYSELGFIQHENFTVNKVGLFVSFDNPHFGASPDATVSCDCCGDGCVEIKCPYCAKDSSIAEAHLKYMQDGKLKTTHQYYYQIQMQMAVCKRKYCDFVLWSENDLVQQRIEFDSDFWQRESVKATQFWMQVILPELFGKFYTRKPQSSESAIIEPQPSGSGIFAPKHIDWCICRKQDDGLKMIKCDNVQCKIQWYHMQCVNVKKARKVWFCDSCKPIKKNKNRN